MMIKTLCALSLAALLAPQAAKSNPDFKYDEKAGISIQKFPKNDEWDFKEMGFMKNSKLVVSHKVDELSIDVLQAPPATTGSYDLKKQVEVDSAGFGGNPAFTEFKPTPTQASKLPLGGGNGANAQFFQATFKLKEAPMELRYWTFLGKENQCLYIVVLVSGEGMYKKHQKIADFILGNIKTYKIPK
jgi:hypothetical protein